jgi:hypothetical protein
MSDTHAELSPPEDSPSYSFRPSLMGAPHIFRLGPDALYYEIGHHAGSVSYFTVRRMRLAFRPTSLATYRFVTEIWSDTAPKLMISSTSWRSVIEQQRQDAAYAAFVRELARRIGASGSTAAFETGSPPLMYWPGLAICAGLLIVLPWIVLRGLLGGSYAGAALVAGVLALFAWQVGNLFWRNRPGRFRPEQVPAAVLPGR